MRLRHLPLLLSLIMAVPPSSAQDADDQHRFSGTWEAKFKGAVICTIKLETGEMLTGATYGCSIHVNQEGDLIETEAPDQSAEPSPISNPKIQDSQLTFETKDGDDVMKLEFTLTGAGRAELRFVDAPVKIKPIRFGKR